VASREFYTIVDLPMRSTGTAANVPFRGVTDRAVDVREGSGSLRPDVRAGQGRGDRRSRVRSLSSATWTSAAKSPGARTSGAVVGVFEAGGSISESEVWTDLTVLQGVYRRGNSVQVCGHCSRRRRRSRP